MPRDLKFPCVVGVRLSVDDHQKLQQLCVATKRVPSDLLRLLLRLAEATDVPQIHLRSEVPVSEPDALEGAAR